jgi:hypothetical protein
MMLRIDIEEGSLQAGVLGLVLALVEIIKDALKTQALRRIEGGDLSEDEIERLGDALMELEQSVTQIKSDKNLQTAVQEIRNGLDDAISEIVEMLDPIRWVEEHESEQAERL